MNLSRMPMPICFIFAFCGFLLTLATTAEAKFLDCSTPDFATNKVHDPSFVCTPIREMAFDAFGRSVKVRTLRSKSDERGLQYEPIVMEAAETTLAWLTGYSESYGLRVQDLTFVFSDTALHHVHDPFAFAGMANPDDCVIKIFPAQLDNRSLEDVLLQTRNTVAHEIFHCIQHQTWPKQAEQYSRGAKWWMEGSAQFIAHWIYESPKDLDARGKQFAKAAQTAPLYKEGGRGEAVVLMAWLADGNIYPIFDFIKAMPTVPGEAAQVEALLSHVPPYLLAEFPRDYANGLVGMPSGYAFPKPEAFGKDEVINSGPLVLSVEPLTLFLYDVTYAGGTYMIAGESTADVNVQEGSEWAGIGLINVEQACAESKTLRFAGMGFGYASESLSLTATKFPGCESCAVTDERQACLIGTWVADQGELATTIHEMLPDTVGDVLVEGNFGVKFNADGTANFGFYKLRVTLGYTLNGVTVSGIDLGGSIDNLWSTSGNKLRMCYVDADAAIQILIPRSFSRDAKTGVMTENPSSSDVIHFAELPMSKSMDYDFACNGSNAMAMTGLIDGTPFTLNFKRAE